MAGRVVLERSSSVRTLSVTLARDVRGVIAGLDAAVGLSRSRTGRYGVAWPYDRGLTLQHHPPLGPRGVEGFLDQAGLAHPGLAHQATT